MSTEMFKQAVHTKRELHRSLRELIIKLDLLKICFNDLESTFLKESDLLETDLNSADVVAISRKRLHRMIDSVEHLLDCNNYMNTCREMDQVYVMLKSIIEQLSQIDNKNEIRSVTFKIEGIIQFANEHVRHLALMIDEDKSGDESSCNNSSKNHANNNILSHDLNPPHYQQQCIMKEEITLTSNLEYSSCSQIVSDDECEIVYENITKSYSTIRIKPDESDQNSISKSGCKMHKTTSVDHNYAKKKVDEQIISKNTEGRKSPEKSEDDESDVLDETLGDYPQSDLSDCTDSCSDNCSDSDIILEEPANGVIARPKIWNLRKVLRKYKNRLITIKNNISEML